MLVVNAILTKPPVKRTPAVDNKNPDVTEVVTIPQGQLTGVYNTDHSVKVYAGIPYAKAPVGELRFKEPQAPEGWEGIKAFDHFGPMAMQTQGSVFMDSLSHILGWHDYQVKFGDEYVDEVSEDCLSLNVFSGTEDLNIPGFIIKIGLTHFHGIFFKCLLPVCRGVQQKQKRVHICRFYVFLKSRPLRCGWSDQDQRLAALGFDTEHFFQPDGIINPEHLCQGFFIIFPVKYI